MSERKIPHNELTVQSFVSMGHIMHDGRVIAFYTHEGVHSIDPRYRVVKESARPGHSYDVYFDDAGPMFVRDSMAVVA